MTKKRKKTHNKSRGATASLNSLKEEILAFLDKDNAIAYSVRQIAKKLNIRGNNSKDTLLNLLFAMEKSGQIGRVRNNFKSVKKGEVHIGTVDFVNSRFAFIVSDDFEDDFKVRSEYLGSALHGDTVEFVVLGGSGKKVKVTNVISRQRTEFVGRLEISPKFAFLVVDGRKMHYDIFVQPKHIKKAVHNDKVIVEITKWPFKGKNPEGKVIRVLGKAGEHNAEIHSIMAEFELPFEFPYSIEEEAKKIKDRITENDIAKRKDFRKTTTFTIDPNDAKDFDDAISFKKLENGNYEVGVHIADVTHYIKKGSALDKEAIHRATSVYLVDRTIPMLPERLSNELCSLRPHEDKLTFAAVFELDKNGNIKKEWFGRTIIHSDRRFTYEEAQEGIETKEGDYADELEILNTLAKKLKVDRFKNGAISFETVEVKFTLDENGKPLGLVQKIRKDAHKLVEEFMLLANKRVATFVYGLEKGKNKKTFIYRVHDNPDPDRLNDFSTFAVKFGHKLDVKKDGASTAINKLMEEIEGKPEQDVLQSVAIRSMSKAIYTTEEKGHFGLAFEHYSHFTSPIRRYPDVMVHRLLQDYLHNGKSAEKEEYEELCEHSSSREKRAADAERASIKYKQVEFMANAPEQDWEGIVSGITEWGIFVEITETKCEGMVRMADLTDDYYEYDSKNFRVVGQRNKKVITLGDQVTVKIEKTDVDRRTIDLIFV